MTAPLRRTGPDWRHTMRVRVERLTPADARLILTNHLHSNGIADQAFANLAGGPTTPAIDRHIMLALAKRAGVLADLPQQQDRARKIQPALLTLPRGTVLRPKPSIAARIAAFFARVLA